MVAHLAQGSHERGIESVAAAYVEDGPIRDVLERGGVRTRLFVGPRGLRPMLPRELAQWLKEEQVDVLHTHHLGPALYGAAAAWLAGIPLVHTEHSVEFYDVPRRRVLGAALDRWARVVAVSPEIATWRERSFGTRSVVVENGIPSPPPAPPGQREALRSSLSVGPGTCLVGCVARLAPEKNHRLLIDAVVGLRQVELVLIGDGPERQALERHAQRLGAPVHFLGTRTDTEKWWCAFDVAALASTREGQPLALIEAMRSGVPVVATAVGGVPALVGAAGRLVPSQDRAALRAELATLANQPALRAELAEAGRTQVERFNSLDTMVDGYVWQYRAVLGRASP